MTTSTALDLRIAWAVIRALGSRFWSEPDNNQTHLCRRPTLCCCGIALLEPVEECLVHGIGEWPPRCEECGRFVPYAR